MGKNSEFQAFSQLLRESGLSGGQRNEAWRIFRAKGKAAAQEYVNQIAAKFTMPRPLATLKDRPLPYRVWGEAFIDQASFQQMDDAMRLPVSVAGALMPDAHKGYGLPIGGVLATENTVIPYAVGVDIACRMMLTVYPVPPDALNDPEGAEFNHLRHALVENTIFGMGAEGLHEGKIKHPVLDASRWQATELLRSLRKTAIHQIGTSGTGNHFCEWGQLTIVSDDNPLGLKVGEYLALLSHSGSRGVGYKIADHYSKLAMALLPHLDESVKHLAWLSLDAEAGQEYWYAMHLAGDFASANHHVIHERIARAAGLTPIAAIENHHNFAWREKVLVGSEEYEAIVHRKGATPAGEGVLGVIPGTMADTGYVVEGKGEPTSLNSASHGGGRAMSRNQAKKTISRKEQADYLKAHGVTLIGGGLDESPQAYKQIAEVLNAQSDLVEVIGKFQPRIVRMASDKPFGRRKHIPEGIIDKQGD
jgi:tRNA-splicing ligase RtcB